MLKHDSLPLGLSYFRCGFLFVCKSGRRGPRGPRPPTPPDVRFRIRRFTLKIETFGVDPAATQDQDGQRMTSGMLRSYAMLPRSTTSLARYWRFSRPVVSPVHV